jgi:hypothetical protein
MFRTQLILMIGRRVAITLALLAVAVPAAAQTSAIVGTVFRDSADHRLSEAEISIPALSRSTTTNYLGEFRFSRLPAGRHVLIIRHIGFAPLVDSVTVADAAMVEREYVLRAQPVRLDSVRITAAEKKYISPGLQEFEERRKQGFGRFIAEDVLRKEEHRQLIDILSAQLPNVARFRPDPRNPGKYYISSGRKCGDGPVILSCKGQAACPITLYLDGALIFNAAHEKDPAMYPDFARYSAMELAGVEYYPGAATVPAKYNMTGSGCGVMLLWTRER